MNLIYIGGINMKFFIDTANIEEIKRTEAMGIIDGVTTNPSLIAKEGKELLSQIKEISTIVKGPISAEVIGEDSETMIKEAKELSKLASNIVIKIPMTEEGLKAVKELSKEKINTNVTLIFSATQALIAANAGATYVSPFVGRLDDISDNGIALVKDIADIFEKHNISTKIIAASIRNPMHVVESAKAGANYATVPYKLLIDMIKHPLTDKGIEKFKNDWNKVFNK